MARQRELLVNIERIRREMDEFFGDAWSRAPAGGRRPGAFAPRVDVYYCKPEGSGRGPRAIVKADLAGVDPDAVSLEISGRELIMSGSRPVRETEGRAYQQVEIPTGAFRRVIELGVEVVAEEASATFEDGILRIELPVKVVEPSARKVPIERAE
jgi:HSP20 family protein